jgi:hypothetical protein
MSALASIYVLDPNAVTSPTNPGAIDNYDVVWREGWGNNPLPQFNISIPQPSPIEAAIVGGYYYINRPSSLPATMNASLWTQSYWAPVSDKSVWKLFNDIPSEIDNPGPLFNTTWTAPVVPTRPIEGPFVTYFQFVSKDTTTAASGEFGYGLDVTPPGKVTGLIGIPGAGAVSVTGWLTQSRILLVWDDVQYDNLSGTGYFEVFLDGEPYPVSENDPTGRRVFDLKEHYPGYGMTINTKREMMIEDLPAGEHVLQVRAVDRATNPGPLSDPVTIKVDPDFPAIEIVSPGVDGERLGARPLYRADVTDRGGVASVAFSVDGADKGVDTEAPYEFVDDLTAFADGSAHTLRVTATDVAGRTNFTEKTFVIDKKPLVSVVSPGSPGQVVSPLVPLKVSYADKTGVTGIVFRVDGVVVSSVVLSSGETTQGVAGLLHRASVGPHTLSVTVSNAVGGVATASSSFVVDSARLPILSDYSSSQGVEGDLPVWYNTEYPAFSAIAAESVPNPTEVLYAVDRSPEGVVDPMSPNAYNASFRVAAGTTYFDGVIDLNGVYLSNPALFDGALQLPGVARPTEGVWYTHAAVRNALGQSGGTISTVYGIDLTPPAAVGWLAAYATPSSGSPSAVLEQSRAIIKWDGSERDALSGTKAYNVYLDGARLGGDDETIQFQPGRSTMSVTLEDLAPGMHTIQISAVDRASNESPKSGALTFHVDTDAPRLSITAPASAGLRLGARPTVSALAEDAGGITTVSFEVDGSPVGVVTSGPPATRLTASKQLDLGGFASGTHTLKVTAKDVAGRTVTASRSFVLDKSAPSISSVSGAPNPFFPRKRDGYKDNFRVKFRTSEAGTAKLVIKNSKGKVVRTLTKKVNAGSQFVSWNGKQTDGRVRAGAFKYTLSMTDAAGNKRSVSPRSVSIRFYEIVRVSSGAVRIVQR